MVISASSSTPGVRIPLPGSTITNAASCRLRSSGAAKGRLHDLLGALPRRLAQQLLCLRRRVAEVEPARPGGAARVLPPLAGPRDPSRVALDLAGSLLAHLDDDSSGGPLPDPGDGLEALGVACGDRPEQLADRAPGEGGHRDLRPHPA